jgi:hypothetical protein
MMNCGKLSKNIVSNHLKLKTMTTNTSFYNKYYEVTMQLINGNVTKNTLPTDLVLLYKRLNNAFKNYENSTQSSSVN